MFYIDFARVVLKDLEDMIEGTQKNVWNATNKAQLNRVAGRHFALLEVRKMIREHLGSDGESIESP